MLIGQGSKGLTRIIAMVCMAIVCVFCVQTTLIALDRIEHALEIEHDANALAGTVQHCAAATDACEQPDGSMAPISHAHSGDAATNILLGSGAVLLAVKFETTKVQLFGSRIGPGVGQITPDRPPKV